MGYNYAPSWMAWAFSLIMLLVLGVIFYAVISAAERNSIRNKAEAERVLQQELADCHTTRRKCY